jgi:hypothetical protein
MFPVDCSLPVNNKIHPKESETQNSLNNQILKTPSDKADVFNLDDSREIKTGYTISTKKPTTTAGPNGDPLKDSPPDSSLANTWTNSPLSPRPISIVKSKPRKSVYRIQKPQAEAPKDQSPVASTVSQQASVLKQPSRAKKIIGIVLMIAVGLVSAYVVFAISAGSNSSSWPWGCWYVVALFFDQLMFQPGSAMIQYSLLYWYVFKKENARVRRLTHLVIGKDIMAVVNSKLTLAYPSTV